MCIRDSVYIDDIVSYKFDVCCVVYIDDIVYYRLDFCFVVYIYMVLFLTDSM